jgi:hypothetical protein
MEADFAAANKSPLFLGLFSLVKPQNSETPLQTATIAWHSSLLEPGKIEEERENNSVAKVPVLFQLQTIRLRLFFLLVEGSSSVGREVVILSGAKDPCISPLSLLLLSSIPTAKPL